MDLDFLYMESFSRLMRPHYGKAASFKQPDGMVIEGTLWMSIAHRMRYSSGRIGELEGWIQILRKTGMGYPITFPLERIKSIYQTEEVLRIFLEDTANNHIGILDLILSKNTPDGFFTRLRKLFFP